MRKILYVLVALFIFVGCGMMDNTPTKKVEALLHKYQINDSEVITDLDNVLLMDSNLTETERQNYRDFMKKHYQDLTYEIKNEKIDGDMATVDAEITVRDYSNVVNAANEYRMDNPSVFDETNTFASYRLDRLNEVSESTIYTLTFHLTKTDGKWQLDPLSTDDESKINGLYGVRDITIDTTNDDNFTDESNSTDNTENDSVSDSSTTENDDMNDNSNKE